MNPYVKLADGLNRKNPLLFQVFGIFKGLILQPGNVQLVVTLFDLSILASSRFRAKTIAL